VRFDLGIGPDETAILIVAHNPALKGLDQLIRAVAFANDHGRAAGCLIVVGRCKGKRRYWNRAFALGLVNSVHFVGPTDEVEAYYAAADLYCQPTFYDPCSLVALEAMAAGLPVVTSIHNGAGELITEGVEGSVIRDPHDIEALAEALTRFSDPATRRAAGRAARELALRHTLRTNYEEMMAVFEEALAAKRERLARKGTTVE
jgi:UDP-glucose:(heptosyl)LPS alpha-1,3-glucosyltransferase